MTGLSRVLIAPEAWGDLPAPQVAAALAQGWQERNAAVSVATCPQSDGGAGLLEVIAASDPRAKLIDASRVPYVEVEHEGSSTATLSSIDAADSFILGGALRELLMQSSPRVVIGLRGSRSIDGGAGLVAALAGLAPQEIDKARTDPAVAQAASELVRDSGVQLVAAYDTGIGLLGLNGAAANAQETLGLSPQVAQDAEAAMGVWAHHLQKVLPPSTDLLTGAVHRVDRDTGAGAGGGLGFALAVLGARLRPATDVVAELTGLPAAIERADLVVTATGVFDWRNLTEGVVAGVGRRATAAAKPAVVLAGRVDVGRRELMSLGYSGGYAVAENPRIAVPRDAAEVREAARRLGYRVAATWTPAR